MDRFRFLRRGRCVMLLPALLLAGCVGIPSAVDLELPRVEPTLAQAQQQPEAHRGQRVRWGGTILGIENSAEYTILEVLARPLSRSTRPNESGTSPGRFIAVVPGFLDPEEYQQGRSVTVVGVLEGIERRKVGEFDYRYPRLLAEGHHLWPPLPETQPTLRDPFWHDPWYRPWWYDPWHPYWRPYRW